MERLTRKEMLEGYVQLAKCSNDFCKSDCDDCEVEREALEKLKSYEDAEEQGLLLRLPCKVGDVVYFPIYDYHNSAIIETIRIEQNGVFFDWVQYEVGVDVTECWDEGCFSIDDIGKTVFLTEAEAEKALEEMG